MFPMPMQSRRDDHPHIRGVQDVTWASWFGGIYKDPQNFFAQFAVDPESYLRMYPEILADARQKRKAFLDDRTGLHRRRRAGAALRVQGRRPDRAAGRHSALRPRRTYDFTVRGIYRSGGAARRQPVDDVPLEVRRRAIDA